MQISLQPGHYVVAVSGGVDSMSLLHILLELPGVSLTVAHFDHGIRPDSLEDARLVKQVAREYDLSFVSQKANLGPATSEKLAREKRYAFLHQVRQASGAEAIVTAHHRDDVLETAIHNIIRGTGRRGLTSLQSSDIVRRPLLDVSKAELRQYASEQGLLWREDSTNSEERYTRNYIRHRIVPRIPSEHAAQIHEILGRIQIINHQTDALITKILEEISDEKRLKRYSYIMLPHSIAREIIAAWLRDRDLRDFDSTLIERLVHAAKTYQPGKVMQINRRLQLRVTKEYLALERLER